LTELSACHGRKAKGYRLKKKEYRANGKSRRMAMDGREKENKKSKRGRRRNRDWEKRRGGESVNLLSMMPGEFI